MPHNIRARSDLRARPIEVLGALAGLFRYANQLPEHVEAAIVVAKKEKPHWGARKIRERLLRRLPHAIRVPAASTVHAVLDRHGLVKRAARSRMRAQGTPLSEACIQK